MAEPGPDSSARSPPFAIEAMVSAGPRKSAAEYEAAEADLCEDGAGFLSAAGLSVFWLCDGTSDGPKLPRLKPGPGGDTPLGGFNARTLAQDLGQAFAEQAAGLVARSAPLAGSDVVQAAFAEVGRSWQARLQAYLARIAEMNMTDRLLDALPRVVDGSYRIKWSATFIGGAFHPAPRRLELVNFGDSGALVMGGQPAVVPPNLNRVVLVASLATESLATPTVTVHAAADTPWSVHQDVSGFALMSDGLDRNDLGALLDTLGTEFSSRPLSELRRHLLSRADLTRDDKSVVFGRFLGQPS